MDHLSTSLDEVNNKPKSILEGCDFCHHMLVAFAPNSHHQRHARAHKWQKNQYLRGKASRTKSYNLKIQQQLTRMQQLKAKLKEVKILAAMLSTHKGKHEKASSGAEAFFPIFLLSYQVRQTEEVTIKSTGRPISRSTTCAPSCSISRILWYVLLLEIIISSLKFRVFTIMTVSWPNGLQERLCFDSKPIDMD